MNILVTGGAGYIGSGLILKIREEFTDSAITSLDNLTRGNYDLIHHLHREGRCRLLVGDVRKKSDLEKVIGRETSAIVHLAAVVGIPMCKENPQKAIATNVYGTHNVLEAARRDDVEKVIFASSAAVYGNPVRTPVSEDHPLRPVNLYGVTKLSGEMLLYQQYVNHGLDTVSLRIGNPYGIGAYTHSDTVMPIFVNQALRGQPLTIYGDGTQSLDFIHIQDVIQAIILALKTDRSMAGESLNVGVGEPTSVNTVAETVSRTVSAEHGKRVTIVHLPPREGEIYNPNFCFDTAKIKEKLHFQPRWSIEDGVRQLIHHHLKGLGRQSGK